MCFLCRRAKRLEIRNQSSTEQASARVRARARDRKQEIRQRLECVNCTVLYRTVQYMHLVHQCHHTVAMLEAVALISAIVCWPVSPRFAPANGWARPK